jgi:hypothetical protein
MSNKQECVKVLVRVRPMNSKEIGKGCKPAITLNEGERRITVVKPGEENKHKTFTFDGVLGVNSTQAFVSNK